MALYIRGLLCRTPCILMQTIRSKGRSALFVSGKNASKQPVIVIPELPSAETLKSDDLVQSVKRRGVDVNLEALVNGAKYIQWIEDEIDQLEDQRQVVAENFKDLNEDENKSANDNEMLEWYKEEAKVIKRKLREKNKDRWELDEKLVPDLLRVPNVVHELTPEDGPKVAFEFTSPSGDEIKQKNHCELAGGDLKFTPNSHTSYYLTGPLAELEQRLLHSIETHLLNSGLSMISCPDFAKAVIVEGCGELDFQDPNQVFSLRPTGDFTSPADLQSMHLVGGASLPAMVSHLAKHIVINPSVLPESCFCIGRQYRPSDGAKGLFSVQQSTAVHCLSHSADRQSMNQSLESIIDTTKRFYEELGLPFNISYQPANKLNAAQSFSATVEMYSPMTKGFEVVGNIAAYEDFLSKRLMLKYEENGVLGNQFIVSGTFANVTRLVACAIEGWQTEDGGFVLPEMS